MGEGNLVEGRGRWRKASGLATSVGQNSEFGGVADVGAGAVAFKIGDGVGPEAGAAIGAAQRLELAVHLRTGDAAAAIGGNSPAANDCVDAAGLRDGFVVAHEDNETASFARPKASGTCVIDAHFLGSERAGLGKSDDLEWIQAEGNAAREGDVQGSRFQGGA